MTVRSDEAIRRARAALAEAERALAGQVDTPTPGEAALIDVLADQQATRRKGGEAVAGRLRGLSPDLADTFARAVALAMADAPDLVARRRWKALAANAAARLADLGVDRADWSKLTPRRAQMLATRTLS